MGTATEDATTEEATTDEQHIQAMRSQIDATKKETDKLKEAYERKIQDHPDFNDVGFILTDYCTDFYDGKQLTIATYI